MNEKCYFASLVLIYWVDFFFLILKKCRMWKYSGIELGEREEYMFIKIQFIFESPNSYSLPKTSKYMKVLIFNFDGYFNF
jgi:hypothetical protein